MPLFASADAQTRIQAALDWLVDSNEPVWLIGATRDAAAALRTEALVRHGSSAMGWEAVSLRGLVLRAAAPVLARDGRIPARGLAAQALAARVIVALHDAGGLGRYASVGLKPGFARAVVRTFEDLRAAGVEAAALRDEDEGLAAIFDAYEQERQAAALADEVDLLEAASEWCPEGRWLLLDVAPHNSAQKRLLESWIARSPHVLATLPAHDATRVFYEKHLGAAQDESLERQDALGRVQRSLFEEQPSQGSLDSSLELFTAAGEGRECMEIVRRVQQAAATGVRFEQMAVFLRQPGLYRAHMVEAFRRAGIDARFSRGTVLPDPAGRALLALLACKAEDYSARAFAEYLSLGVVPVLDEGAPPTAQAWAAADEYGRDALSDEQAARSDESDELVGLDADAAGGSLRVPQHWETLLVDATVIGTKERWARRLDALDRRLDALLSTVEDPDDPKRARFQGQRESLGRLRRFALPILDTLEALPSSGTWEQWLPRLRDLVAKAIREPERVLNVLAELAPMGPVGPVDLAEVQLVLSSRLLDLVQRPTRADRGVFVGSVDEAHGRRFDVVFIPGLAEKVFPPKVQEDPLLIDEVRARLSSDLGSRSDAIDDERLRLRVACGAASKKLFVSWPYVDVERARPRVPSFYALEIDRAAQGRLPSFDELHRRAQRASTTVIGWPAPDDAMDAVDDAEFDLAQVRRLSKAPVVGGAAYLHEANANLKRSLKRRARRWNTKNWTLSDGLLLQDDSERLAGQRPASRPYSATALQRFAVCPYQAALYTFFGLSPREEPEPVEDLDPLQRGSLIHDIQFHVLSRLRDENQLPLDHPQRLAYARQVLDEVTEEVAARHADVLAPAIERVWQDAVADIRHDLNEWLTRMHDEPDWQPAYFELAFGLPMQDQERDPQSVVEPLDLDIGVRFRGAIDLVERHGDLLRATDFKTGRVPAYVGQELVIAGGRALQPLFYALALEKLFPGVRAEGGRLYYCTARGRYEERVVRLDDVARSRAKHFIQVLDQYVRSGFFPAAPVQDGCRYCDYAPVCGPHEERRIASKDPRRLTLLNELREER